MFDLDVKPDKDGSQGVVVLAFQQDGPPCEGYPAASKSADDTYMLHTRGRHPGWSL
jgi:hypothetical protein